MTRRTVMAEVQVPVRIWLHADLEPEGSVDVRFEGVSAADTEIVLKMVEHFLKHGKPPAPVVALADAAK